MPTPPSRMTMPNIRMMLYSAWTSDSIGPASETLRTGLVAGTVRLEDLARCRMLMEVQLMWGFEPRHDYIPRQVRMEREEIFTSIVTAYCGRFAARVFVSMPASMLRPLLLIMLNYITGAEASIASPIIDLTSTVMK